MKFNRFLSLLALFAVFAWRLSSAGSAEELKVGQMAPNFSLRGSDGKTYTLSQFRGKRAVVLAWFPKAFTGGCTAECKSLGESGKAIKAYDVEYFAASVDGPEKNKEFAQSLNLPFPVLSDPTKVTANAYGVIGVLPFARRWTFYIGKDGRIEKVDQSVKPASAGADLQASLAQLGVPKVK